MLQLRLAGLVQVLCVSWFFRSRCGEPFVATLRECFRAGRNLKLTAAALNIHRNSLAYRMRQIRRLTGLDLDDPEQRQLAENALRVLMPQQPRDEKAARRRRAQEPSS